MKFRTAFLSVAILSTVALAESPVEYNAVEAAKHVGETITVTDRVDDVFKAKGGNIFLNLGGAHPKNAFTIFISNNYAGDFPDPNSYYQATVSVTGKVETHRKKPQIVVSSPAEIVIKKPGPNSGGSPAAAATPTPAASASP